MDNLYYVRGTNGYIIVNTIKNGETWKCVAEVKHISDVYEEVKREVSLNITFDGMLSVVDVVRDLNNNPIIVKTKIGTFVLPIKSRIEKMDIPKDGWNNDMYVSIISEYVRRMVENGRC